MEYIITIQQIRREETTVADYVKLADTGGKDGGAEYGYKQRPVIKEEAVQVYSQRATDIDLPAVICAVNRITQP